MINLFIGNQCHQHLDLPVPVVNKTKLVAEKVVINPSLHPKITYYNRTERLWFLSNGTARLTGREATKLALWPEEIPANNTVEDRVVNQLMYVPENYDRNLKRFKKIFLSTTDIDWKLSLGRKEFLRCPVSTCLLVPSKDAPKADLIFFKNRYGFNDLEKDRPSHQIWLKFEIESAANIQLLGPDNAFNWTATYRHDSEISTPYYKFYPYEDQTRNRVTTTSQRPNYGRNKTKKVAWFVSNCFAANKRLEYANQLAKYIEVDIYGQCGTKKCLKKDNDLCQQMLDRDYKFYLSFENSNCKDYITEKFWINGLAHNIVPIVMGAHPDTYKQLAPPHSYIHVDDFKSPKELANYLHKLDNDDHLYNEYFAWKGIGELKEIFMWCRVCALLHAPPSPRYYKSLQNWWEPEGTCVPITWTSMSIEE
ncbi:glycoprotein 3-alpha-L-fucosyltransferase A-like [Oppia nitens]|uniref:glycoprotein 3-alpha-L-fucosyltransferase A-like n=1 Tax=Oppia nitens TaxID=1686743 RepID=UPI0023DA8883|nr:glycoprotein 3-alpha-L-fucosyltransferase A-like [Oppia nitens]